MTPSVLAGQVHCACGPAPTAGAFWTVVFWTGWVVALTAILVMSGAGFCLGRHLSTGTVCGHDLSLARIEWTLMLSVPVAFVGALVGIFVPH